MLTANNTQQKNRDVLRVAQDLYQQRPHWVTFFREILGIEGAVRRAFPEPDQMLEFESSPEHEEIQRMLSKLRESRGVTTKESEPTRVITVRLPKSMHESLMSEAKTRKTSMNKLCISKLLQMIDQEFVPEDKAKKRKKSNAQEGEGSQNGAETPATFLRPFNAAPPMEGAE